VPASVFWPRPDVASAVVSLVPTGEWDDAELAVFTATVKTLFGQRRKKLRNQLRQHFGLDGATVDALGARLGIDIERRPEQCTRAEFRQLAVALAERGPS